MNLVSVAALLVILGMIFGAFVFLKAEMAIKLQMKFYEKINWRMVPVSMQKEVRNTKIMGLGLMIFCLFAIAYIEIVSRRGYLG